MKWFSLRAAIFSRFLENLILSDTKSCSLFYGHTQGITFYFTADIGWLSWSNSSSRVVASNHRYLRIDYLVNIHKRLLSFFSRAPKLFGIFILVSDPSANDITLSKKY